MPTEYSTPAGGSQEQGNVLGMVAWADAEATTGDERQTAISAAWSLPPVFAGAGSLTQAVLRSRRQIGM
jgi:hypothetical protein